jgi:hypothetical protein
MTRVLIAMALLAVTRVAAAACEPSGGVQFICGLPNAEDLVRLRSTPWVIASEIHTAGDDGFGAGPLHAIRVDTRQTQVLFPGAAAAVKLDARAFPDCASPPAMLITHGLNVRRFGTNRFRLYAVNHGNRESIEVFDVEADARHIAATWRGCLLSPQGMVLNAVAPLSRGGMIVTSTGAAARPGGVAGAVAVWHPRVGWRQLTNLVAHDNGIEVSADGKWVFVAGSDEKTLNRFTLDEGMAKRQRLQLDFGPDNLRWGDDGFLYVAGSTIASYQASRDCSRQPVCAADYTVLRVEPRTMKAEVVLKRHGMAGVFGAATTALKIGDTIWTGSFRGDRVAILPLH